MFVCVCMCARDFVYGCDGVCQPGHFAKQKFTNLHVEPDKTGPAENEKKVRRKMS